MGKNYEDYKCTDCGASGVKLWRDYGQDGNALMETLLASGRAIRVRGY